MWSNRKLLTGPKSRVDESDSGIKVVCVRAQRLAAGTPARRHTHESQSQSRRTPLPRTKRIITPCVTTSSEPPHPLILVVRVTISSNMHGASLQSKLVVRHSSNSIRLSFSKTLLGSPFVVGLSVRPTLQHGARRRKWQAHQTLQAFAFTVTCLAH